jgi:oligopeptide/dipeptide ABC transporter ATP-binding protein
MTVGQQIAEALWIHRLARRRDLPRRVAELLDQVGLGGEVRDRFPNALSGGQRQRVGIARALAVDPALLILDEPLSALDVSIQAQIVNLLVDLQRQRRLSYLFITHDLRIVHHLADRVAVLYLGRIVEEAPTAELFASPRHPYSRLLLSSLPGLARPAPAVVLDADPPSPFEPPSGCAFHPRCPLAFDRCRAELPRLVPLGTARARVACFAAERDEPTVRTPVA